MYKEPFLKNESLASFALFAVSCKTLLSVPGLRAASSSAWKNFKTPHSCPAAALVLDKNTLLGPFAGGFGFVMVSVPVGLDGDNVAAAIVGIGARCLVNEQAGLMFINFRELVLANWCASARSGRVLGNAILQHSRTAPQLLD